MFLTATIKNKHGHGCHCAVFDKQTIKVMRLLSFLLLVFTLHLQAKTYSQKVTLSLKEVALPKVFKAIRQQTGYNFFYKSEWLKGMRPVSVNVQNASVEEVLTLCFKDQPLNFELIERSVVIKPKETTVVPRPVFTNEIPQSDITGRVYNDQGEPLGGANVTIKRTGKGTLADANGNFRISNIERNDILIVSYVGYISQSVQVGDKTNLTLMLEFANNELDKAVVQAYGKTNKRLSTGNIGVVRAEEIEKQPVINPLQALQGRVAGLEIIQTSGYASAPFKVELRGRNAIDNRFPSDPLYIIDGVPLTILDIGGSSSVSRGSMGLIQNGFNGPAEGQSPLFNINPTDIESIEVLKDADATAIYGSRGANGVIIITTKKEKPVRPALILIFNRE